ncbi:MAG: hypothetical protein PHG04_01905 [Candidatus Nanoarchaeia archaeon]|nr:hypothetical protein [Candidatus Nanoarchaeia archaeon]MDD5054116.1 hypothetical protein [Candidatus Nanoarchaeia archaeon]
MNDYLILSITIIYALLAYFIPIILCKKGKLEKFSARSLVHLFAGLSIFSLLFIENKILLFIASAMFTIVLFFSRKSTPVLKFVFNSLNEPEEKKCLQGPILYSAAISFLVLFSAITGNIIVPVASALIMIISDPLASFFGKKYGKNKMSLLSTQRTFEGSFAMMMSAGIIVSLIFGFGIKAFAIGFILAIIELITPSKMDDFSLPLAACILLTNY